MPDEETEDTGGFTVRDRRRYVSDDVPEPTPATPEVAVSAPAATASPDFLEDFPDADEDDAEGAEERGLPDVHSVLALFLGELSNLAWIRMGMVANPMTGKIERDLPQARVAIDTIGYLAGQLDAVVPPDERRQLKTMVSDLQINFVEQSRRAGAGS